MSSTINTKIRLVLIDDATLMPINVVSIAVSPDKTTFTARVTVGVLGDRKHANVRVKNQVGTKVFPVLNALAHTDPDDLTEWDIDLLIDPTNPQ